MNLQASPVQPLHQMNYDNVRWSSTFDHGTVSFRLSPWQLLHSMQSIFIMYLHLHHFCSRTRLVTLFHTSMVSCHALDPVMPPFVPSWTLFAMLIKEAPQNKTIHLCVSILQWKSCPTCSPWCKLPVLTQICECYIAFLDLSSPILVHTVAWYKICLPPRGSPPRIFPWNRLLPKLSQSSSTLSNIDEPFSLSSKDCTSFIKHPPNSVMSPYSRSLLIRYSIVPSSNHIRVVP